MMTMLKKFWMEEDGGESVEWPLVVGLIAVVAILMMTSVGTHVTGIFSKIATELAKISGITG